MLRGRLPLLLALGIGVVLLDGHKPARAANLTGAEVLERCESTQASEVAWCVGYVFGVSGVIADTATDIRYRACFPAEFTSEIARLVVVRGIKATDALLDVAGHQAVWYALKKGFPCPEQ